jgi:hypothetical protein
MVKSFASEIKGFIKFGLLRSPGRLTGFGLFSLFCILWLLGFSFHIGGALIHLLLVVGLVVLVINLLSGRRSAV